MRLLCLALVLFVALAGRRLGRRGDDPLAGPPDRRLADDGRRCRAAALRSRRPALAGNRHRPVPDAERRRPLERLAARRARGRGPARPSHPRDAGACRLASRQPVLGRALRPARLAHPRRRAPAARLVRLEPHGALDPSRRLHGGLAEDRHPRGVACERRDPARRPALRRPRVLRRRPPHGGLELVHGCAVARDRPRDPALPREGQRLERHRLQLSRRQVRPGVRGPDRRHRPQRRRRARRGVQLRVDRRCHDRQLRRDVDHSGRAARARVAARLASRRRARRPALARQLVVRRQPEVPARHAREAARDLGPPRHRVHELPRDAAVREAAEHRRAGRGDRPAEALRPDGQGLARRADRLHRAPLGARRVGGDRAQRGREGSRDRSRGRRDHLVDVGLAGCGACLVHLDDGGGLRHPPGERHDRIGAAARDDSAARAPFCSPGSRSPRA